MLGNEKSPLLPLYVCFMALTRETLPLTFYNFTVLVQM